MFEEPWDRAGGGRWGTPCPPDQLGLQIDPAPDERRGVRREVGRADPNETQGRGQLRSGIRHERRVAVVSQRAIRGVLIVGRGDLIDRVGGTLAVVVVVAAVLGVGVHGPAASLCAVVGGVGPTRLPEWPAGPSREATR
ncbi:hypothetical protein GCM10009795_004860 [Nocardioides hankookensis]